MHSPVSIGDNGVFHKTEFYAIGVGTGFSVFVQGLNFLQPHLYAIEVHGRLEQPVYPNMYRWAMMITGIHIHGNGCDHVLGPHIILPLHTMIWTETP